MLFSMSGPKKNACTGMDTEDATLMESLATPCTPMMDLTRYVTNWRRVLHGENFPSNLRINRKCWYKLCVSLLWMDALSHGYVPISMYCFDLPAIKFYFFPLYQEHTLSSHAVQQLQATLQQSAVSSLNQFDCGRSQKVFSTDPVILLMYKMISFRELI